MTTVRTHQFFNGSFADNVGIVTLYTVPAGHRAVVKYASLFHAGSNTPGCFLGIESAGPQFGIFLASSALPSFTLLAVVECYAVAEAGESIMGLMTATGGDDPLCHVGGVLFEL